MTRIETLKELVAVGEQITLQIAALRSEDATERELVSTRASIDAKIVELLAQGQKEEVDARTEMLDAITALRDEVRTLSALVSKMKPTITVNVPERNVIVEGAKIEMPQQPAPNVTIQHSEPVPTRTRRSVTRLSPMGDPLESVEEHEYDVPKRN